MLSPKAAMRMGQADTAESAASSNASAAIILSI